MASFTGVMAHCEGSFDAATADVARLVILSVKRMASARRVIRLVIFGFTPLCY